MHENLAGYAVGSLVYVYPNQLIYTSAFLNILFLVMSSLKRI